MSTDTQIKITLLFPYQILRRVQQDTLMKNTQSYFLCHNVEY